VDAAICSYFVLDELSFSTYNPEESIGSSPTPEGWLENMFLRLHERAPGGRPGRRGLSCDEDGLFFGGECSLVAPVVQGGRKSYQVRAAGEISRALSSEYGVPFDASPYLPALRRIADQMTTGQWGLAKISALQMRLPEPATRREPQKLRRFNPNHYPPGPKGGQFAPRDAGGNGTTPAPTAGLRGKTPTPKVDRGKVVRAPNGRTFPDPNSPTGLLMSPVADLTPVAEAGRKIGRTYSLMPTDPGAEAYLYTTLNRHIGQGGIFDYQRTGNFITGFTQRRQFRDVSNFNVGLLMQQTGLYSLDNTLGLAGFFASVRSSNYRPEKPHGLDSRTAAWIKAGYEAGASGIFGQASQK
jgi:hypothetical protein